MPFENRMWLYILLLMFVLNDGHPVLDKNEYLLKDIEAAIKLLSRVKTEIDADSKKTNNTGVSDCADLYKIGFSKSNIYNIWPKSRISNDKSIKVFCDMTDGGGWTVLYRKIYKERGYYDKDWESYKNGFGDLNSGFWLGNDNIFMMTNQRLYRARFDHSLYRVKGSYFFDCALWIDDESNGYKMHLKNCSGSLSKSLTERYVDMHKMKFITKDHDNDLHFRNCTQALKHGWWLKDCLKPSTLFPFTYAPVLKIRPTNF